MSEKITFRELVELIAKQSEQSQSSTNSFIGELVNIIESGLRSSGSVSISGFGKFELRWMKERPGVNPQTGEEITIPGQNKVVFKPYKALREEVNRPYAKMEARVLDEKPSDSDEKSDDSDKNNINDKVASTSTGATADKDDSDGEDFLVEHPNPARKEPEELTQKSPDTKPEESKKGLAPLASEQAEKQPKSRVKAEHPVNEKRPALTPGKESEMVDEVQKKSTMKWSYAAAAVLVALVIFLMFFMSRQSDDGTTDQIASQPDQLTEQVDPETDQDDAETETSDEPEPDPPPPDSESETASDSDDETEIHTVEQGESLWSIAEAELGNPYLWPAIYNLNQNEIENPNLIQSSSDLTVPVFSDPDNLTEQERSQVAEGYLAVYQWTRTNNPDDAKHFLWAVGVFSPDLLDQAASSVDQADLAFAKSR